MKNNKEIKSKMAVAKGRSVTYNERRGFRN